MQCRELGGDHLPALWRQLGAVTGALDDHLVRRVGQTIECGVPEDGVVEEAQPFVDATVAGEGEAGSTVTLDDQFVEILALLGVAAAE